MYTREDIERITENMLRELTLELIPNNFPFPNRRTIILKYNNSEISRVSFNVVEKDYE